MNKSYSQTSKEQNSFSTNNVTFGNFQETENYAGYRLTILDPQTVSDILSICEPEGYSALLKIDPKGESLDYLLQDSCREGYAWYIDNSYLRQLLGYNAITLTKEQPTNE